MLQARKSTAVQVVDYDPDWPRTFQHLKEQIWPSISDVAIGIDGGLVTDGWEITIDDDDDE